MKKSIYIILYTFFALLGVGMTSCLSENLDDCDCYGDNEKLAFHIKVPKSTVVTRATEDGQGNENIINSLTLYFFDGETMSYNAPMPAPITEGTDMLLPIDKTDETLFQGNINYTVYAVANMDDDLSGKTLTQFKEYVTNKAIGNSESGQFVMIASVTPTVKLKLHSNDNHIGNFELKRVAVKVRMKLAAFNMTGYTASQATVTLKNITDQGYLENEDLPTGTTLSDSEPGNLDFGGEKSEPFYSYPNFWESAPDKATYFLLTVPIQKEGTNETKNYYYSVPVNGDETNIKANHLYDITVTVNKLGSLDPDNPEPIDAFFTVKDWADKPVNSEIKAAHYLMVSETYVEMKNITEYLIDYTTSDPIEITNVKGVFIYVSNQTGQEVIEETKGNQIPQVTLETGNKIKIVSAIPANYIPKKITFTIGHTTNTGIDPLHIEVWQYPPTFITNTKGTKSSWRPDGTLAYGLTNKSIYRITNLVPDELPGNAVLGFPTMESVKFYDRTWNVWEGRYDYNDRHTDYITKDSEEVANMISPNFELASQLGATVPMIYDERWSNGKLIFYPKKQDERYALFTCALYTETRKINGVDVVLNDWRLPTRAEIQLIDKMQAQGTSVTKIMTGKYYWSNLSNSGIMIEKITSGGEATLDNAHVRCVRDVKEAPFK